MLQILLKTIIRNFVKHRYFSLVNILGLAIGFTAFLYITAYVFNEFSYDRFNSKADRIFRSVMTLKFGDTKQITTRSEMPLGPAAKEDLPEVEETVRLYPLQNVVSRYKDKEFREDEIWFAEPSFFKVFDYKLIEGNPETVLTKPNHVLLTQTAVAQIFRRRKRYR